MRPGLSDSLLFAAYVAAGLLAAAIAGWLTIGGVIFGHPAVLFRYLAVGFCGALIYVSVRTRGLLLALVMIVVLLAGHVLLSNTWTREALVEAAIWSLFAGVAYLGAAYVFRAMRRVFLGKFLLMAAFLAAAYAAGTVLILLLRERPLVTGIILTQAVAGLRLGALSGFLFELTDFIGSKSDPDDVGER